MAGTVTLIYVRTLGYAMTSLFAFVSGFFIASKSLELSSMLLVAAWWLATLPFFLFYAHAYDFNHSSSRWDDARYDARVVLAIVVPALIALCILAFLAIENRWPGAWYWSVLIGLIFTSFAYGNYIERQRDVVDGGLAARHQLVWPVILSISVPLYLGLFFSEAELRITLFLPLIILVAVFALSFRLERIRFTLVTTLPLIIVTVVNIWGLEDTFSEFWGSVFHYLSSLALFIGIAAYLAVFEAWRLTSFLAQRESKSTVQSQTPQLYRPTMTALTVAWLSLPILFIYGKLGKVFLFGLAVHGALAFSCWFWAGQSDENLQRLNWITAKNFFGFGFLVILVLDSVIGIYPANRFFAGFVDIAWWAVAFAVQSSLVGIAYKFDTQGISPSDIDGWLDDLKRNGRYFLLVLIGAGLLLSLLIVAGQQLYSDADLSILAKADRSYVLFLVISFVSAIAFLGRNSLRKMRSKLFSLSGVLIAVRAWTSSLVGLIIVLAGYRHGIHLLENVHLAVPIALAAAGGFGLNDVFDIERDKVNKPWRALPQGRVSRVGLIWCSVVILTVATMWVLFSPLGVELRVLQMGAIVGVIAYSPLSMAAPLLKPWLSACISSIPVIVALELSEQDLTLLFIVSTVIFLAGREYLMDVLDRRGDRATKLNTLPVLWGEKVGTFVGGALTLISVALLLLVVFASSSLSIAGSLLMLAAIAGILVFLFEWFWLLHLRRSWLIVASWIPMVFAFLGMVW